MKPGRELDALIAEKVMGIDLSEVPPPEAGSILPHEYWKQFHKGVGSPRMIPKPYSTSIEAAWLVVDSFAKEDEISISHMYKAHKDESTTNYWECFIETDGEKRLIAEAQTAPHAICLAALKAVGYE